MAGKKVGDIDFSLGRTGGCPIIFGEKSVYERAWNILSHPLVFAGMLPL